MKGESFVAIVYRMNTPHTQELPLLKFRIGAVIYVSCPNRDRQSLAKMDC